MTLTRRQFGIGIGAAALSSVFCLAADAAGVLSVSEAYAQAKAGKTVLIDIRTPEEWSETGSATVAKQLDMRRDDFVAVLDGFLGGDRSRPVALICARGSRSSKLSRVLREAGYSNIIDVPEGMLGSYAGPGWLAQGLPVSR